MEGMELLACKLGKQVFLCCMMLQRLYQYGAVEYVLCGCSMCEVEGTSLAWHGVALNDPMRT